MQWNAITKRLERFFCMVNQKGLLSYLNEQENVNHPSHYQSAKMEVIEVIEAFDLGFNLGNVAKYLLRAGRKGKRLEDLKKAQWYLNREIEKETHES